MEKIKAVGNTVVKKLSRGTSDAHPNLKLWRAVKNEKKRNKKLVESLLEKSDSGVDPNFRLPDNSSNYHDQTVLHVCCELNKHEVAEVIISRGGDVNAKALNEMSPLHWCGLRDSRETATVLIKHDAELNNRDRDGRTALHLCGIHNSCNTAGVLMQAGVDLDATDKDGKTALHYCSEEKSTDVARLIISAPAFTQLLARDKDGKTALNIAHRKVYGAMEYLLETATETFGEGAEGARPRGAEGGTHRPEEGEQRRQGVGSGGDGALRDLERSLSTEDRINQYKIQLDYKERTIQDLKRTVDKLKRQADGSNRGSDLAEEEDDDSSETRDLECSLSTEEKVTQYKALLEAKEQTVEDLRRKLEETEGEKNKMESTISDIIEFIERPQALITSTASSGYGSLPEDASRTPSDQTPPGDTGTRPAIFHSGFSRDGSLKRKGHKQPIAVNEFEKKLLDFRSELNRSQRELLAKDETIKKLREQIDEMKRDGSKLDHDDKDQQVAAQQADEEVKQRTEEGVEQTLQPEALQEEVTLLFDMWRAEDVVTITDDMARDLAQIPGVSMYGVDGERSLVVYCHPDNFHDAKKQVAQFHDRFAVSICVIGQELNILPAVDQLWHLATWCGPGQPPRPTCALGLPVHVTEADEGEPAEGLLGCYHCLVALTDSAGESLRTEKISEIVTKAEVNLTDSQFVTCQCHDTQPVPLGTKAIGVLTDRAEASLTYLTTYGLVEAQPPWPCSNEVLTSSELKDLPGKPVWKRGPVTRETQGEVLYSQVRFLFGGKLDCEIRGAVLVAHHYNSGGQEFARQGDSSSVVYCRPDCWGGKCKLLGAVSAIMSQDVNPREFSAGVWVRKCSSSGDGEHSVDSSDVLAQGPEPEQQCVMTLAKGVTFVLPYCYLIEGLVKHWGVQIKVPETETKCTEASTYM